MSEFNKYSTDGGATFIDVEDSNAVHWGDQSKGYVGKNHLKVENTTTTISNVSFTVNSDKSITINGTNNSGSTITFNLMVDTLYFNDFKGKSFYLSGGTNNASVFMAVRHTDSTPTSAYANRGDVNQLIPIPDVIRNVSLSIQVANGTTVSNETVYPMLRLTSIPDSTYEPWYMSNRDLTEYKADAKLALCKTKELSNSDNLDDIKQVGIYTITSAPTNSPEGSIYCTMLVLPKLFNETEVIQVVIGNPGGGITGIYVRKYASSSWTGWVKFSGVAL